MQSNVGGLSKCTPLKTSDRQQDVADNRERQRGLRQNEREHQAK
jgi:hypothetical protein